MIKRITVVAILMLANLILLAHAVVPHHHHNKLICFKYSHCTHDDLNDEHGKNQDGHRHDGENNHDDCVLKEPVGVLSNQSRSDFTLNSTNDRSGLDDYNDYLLDRSPEFQIHALSTVIYERVLNGSYSSLVSSSLGLRAPPVV